MSEPRTIKDLLRYGTGARVSCGGRWLVIDEETGEYVVYDHKPYARSVTELIRTASETEAVKVLDPGDEEATT